MLCCGVRVFVKRELRESVCVRELSVCEMRSVCV